MRPLLGVNQVALYNIMFSQKNVLMLDKTTRCHPTCVLLTTAGNNQAQNRTACSTGNVCNFSWVQASTTQKPLPLHLTSSWSSSWICHCANSEEDEHRKKKLLQMQHKYSFTQPFWEHNHVCSVKLCIHCIFTKTAWQHWPGFGASGSWQCTEPLAFYS